MASACGPKNKGKLPSHFCRPLRILQLNAEIQVFASAIHGVRQADPTSQTTPKTLNPKFPKPKNLLKTLDPKRSLNVNPETLYTLNPNLLKQGESTVLRRQASSTTCPSLSALPLSFRVWDCRFQKI